MSSWSFLDEEEKKLRQQLQETVTQSENLAIQETQEVYPTQSITGIIHSPNVKEFVLGYKNAQKQYDSLIEKKSTADEFLSVYPNYELQALDYTTGYGTTLQDFHNSPSDTIYWNNRFAEEDQQVVDNANKILYARDIDNELNLSARGINPQLGTIEGLGNRNKLGFTQKTLAKGSAEASLYSRDEKPFQLILENDIRKRLPEDRRADIVVVPVNQATAESIGSSAPLENNFAIVDKTTGVYELVNEKGMFDNVSAFTASLATPEMAVNLGIDVGASMLTRNPYVLTATFFSSALFGYGGVKDFYSNPKRLEGTGYVDGTFKTRDNLMIGGFSALFGVLPAISQGSGNIVRSGLNVNVPDNLKRAVKILQDSGYEPSEILTAGNFAGFFKALQNQSKALSGDKGAVYNKMSEQEKVFGEMFSAILKADGKTLDDVLEALDSKLMQNVYATADDTIRNDATQKVLNKQSKNVFETDQSAVQLGDNLVDMWKLTSETSKKIKGEMFDVAETNINKMIEIQEQFGYRVFFEIPPEVKSKIKNILEGMPVPQGMSITGRQNVDGAVIEGVDPKPLKEIYDNALSNEVNIKNVEADKIVSKSKNLPPINFDNIPDPIKSKFKAIMGESYNTPSGALVERGAGISISPDTRMVQGIFGQGDKTAFQILRGLERQITDKLEEIKSNALTNGSTTATYTAEAKDLMELKGLVNEILDVNNLKKVKSETVVVDGMPTQQITDPLPIGQQNQQVFQDAYNALQNAKSFAAYNEEVFGNALFANLRRDTFFNEMPQAIFKNFSDNGDIVTLNNQITQLYRSVDTLSEETLLAYYPKGKVPKRVKQLIDAGIKRREAIKTEFSENFAAHLMQVSPDELSSLLKSTRNNKAVFKTMFGDQAEEVYTNLKMYNVAQQTLESNFDLAFAPKSTIKKFINARLGKPDELVEFMNRFQLTGTNKEAFEGIYLNEMLSGAFSKIGADGSQTLNLKNASDRITSIMQEYQKKNSPLKELMSPDTFNSLRDLKFLMDTIAMNGNEMGNSLVTAAIAADAGKIAKPKVMAYALWNIFKYEQIGKFLVGDRKVFGKTLVQRLLDPIEKEPAQLGVKNAAISNAVVPVYQAWLGVSDSQEQDLLYIQDLIRNQMTVMSQIEPQFYYSAR